MTRQLVPPGTHPRACALVVILAIAVLIPARSHSSHAADDATPAAERPAPAAAAEGQADRQVTPDETPVPPPTETPTEIPGGRTEIVAGEATAGYSGDVVLAPAQVEPAPDGEIAIASSPGDSQDAAPGTDITYTHSVTTAGGDEPAVVNLAATSSEGWDVALLEADGQTLLADHNADGTPDTGPLEVGVTFDFVVALVVPDGTLAGVVDVTTVTATRVGVGDEEQWKNAATASDTTTVNPVLTLSIQTGDVDFGAVAPDGANGGTADAGGASYVASDAITVTVSTNTDAWTGTCRVEETTTPAGMDTADGTLAWQLADGSTSVTPFTTTAPGDPACFPSHEAGDSTYTYDLHLRVDWTDSPGDYRTRIVFAAAAGL